MKAKDKKKLPVTDRINRAIKRRWFKITFSVDLWYKKNILGKYRKFVAERAFKTVQKVQKWNQAAFDTNVKSMYKAVREKEALLLKERIIDTRKGGQHVKLLLIETPAGEMEIILRKEDYPDLYEKAKSKKAQLKAVK